MPRRNGTAGAAIGVPQMNTPGFPPFCRCSHSTSRIKFSNCRVVRSAPVGRPVQWIIASRTLQVSGAQFAFTQPVRSRPLNNGTNPSSSAAASLIAQITAIPVARRKVFMRGVCTRLPGNARKMTGVPLRPARVSVARFARAGRPCHYPGSSAAAAISFASAPAGRVNR